ncbi:MAG TPA: ATP-binding cassette domain-containing protein, partial [Promineifilum sp.]|nr:ATP-binding cassette domain-containing protein [Promineifilum sp.]
METNMTPHVLGDDIIVIKDLYKDFGSVVAVNGFSLTVRRGEVIVIVGPSGSGKSTVLRCINHLEMPTSGSVYIDGVRLEDKQTDINLVRAEVGMVFQQFNLFGHLTVRENVLVGSFSGAKRERVDHVADTTSLLERLSLDDVADEHAMSLPYGAQRRVEIARALAGRPDYLLL